jgi:hypothetical protein
MSLPLFGLARPAVLQACPSRICGLRKLSRISLRSPVSLPTPAKWPIKAPIPPRCLLPRFQSTSLHQRTFFNPIERSYSTAQVPLQPLPPLPSATMPILTHPTVAYYLFGMSALIFAIVVVGGLTRLTESGLSITEWNVVSGVLPPMSEEGWREELAKYLVTPEGRLWVAFRKRGSLMRRCSMNKNISLEDFKFIYSMEWGHRILGRVLGLSFLRASHNGRSRLILILLQCPSRISPTSATFHRPCPGACSPSAC